MESSSLDGLNPIFTFSNVSDHDIQNYQTSLWMVSSAGFVVFWFIFLLVSFVLCQYCSMISRLFSRRRTEVVREGPEEQKLGEKVDGSLDRSLDGLTLPDDSSQDISTLKESDCGGRIRCGKLNMLSKTLPRGCIVGILCLCFVVTQCATNVTQKILMNRIKTRYSFFAEQFMNIMYVPQAFMLTIFLLCTGLIKHVRGFNHIYYLILAVIDSVGIVLIGVGVENTPGQIQVVLGQFIIPVTMVFSILLLKKSYRLYSYVGCLVILFGASLTILSPQPSNNSNPRTKWYSCLIYTVGSSIFGLSFVLKERFFKMSSVTTTPFHLTTIVAFYMVPISFVIYPIQSIPGFGGLPIGQLLPSLFFGAKCIVGYNSEKDDKCSLGDNLWPLITFTICTFFTGVFAVVVTSWSSALVQYVVNCICVPVNCLVYCLVLNEGFSWWIIISMGVIAIGSVVYLLGDDEVVDWKRWCVKRKKNGVNVQHQEEEDEKYYYLTENNSNTHHHFIYNFFVDENPRSWREVFYWVCCGICECRFIANFIWKVFCCFCLCGCYDCKRRVSSRKSGEYDQIV